MGEAQTPTWLGPRGLATHALTYAGRLMAKMRNLDDIASLGDDARTLAEFLSTGVARSLTGLDPRLFVDDETAAEYLNNDSAVDLRVESALARVPALNAEGHSSYETRAWLICRLVRHFIAIGDTATSHEMEQENIGLLAPAFNIATPTAWEAPLQPMKKAHNWKAVYASLRSEALQSERSIRTLERRVENASVVFVEWLWQQRDLPGRGPTTRELDIAFGRVTQEPPLNDGPETEPDQTLASPAPYGMEPPTASTVSQEPPRSRRLLIAVVATTAIVVAMVVGGLLADDGTEPSRPAGPTASPTTAGDLVVGVAPLQIYESDGSLLHDPLPGDLGLNLAEAVDSARREGVHVEGPDTYGPRPSDTADGATLRWADQVAETTGTDLLLVPTIRESVEQGDEAALHVDVRIGGTRLVEAPELYDYYYDVLVVPVASPARAAPDQFARSFEEAVGLAASLEGLVLGMGDYLVGEMESAVEHWTEVEADPAWKDLAQRSGAIHLLLGNAHLHLRDFDAARAAYLRAAEIEPDSLRPQAGLLEVELVEILDLRERESATACGTTSNLGLQLELRDDLRLLVDDQSRTAGGSIAQAKAEFNLARLSYCLALAGAEDWSVVTALLHNISDGVTTETDLVRRRLASLALGIEAAYLRQNEENLDSALVALEQALRLRPFGDDLVTQTLFEQRAAYRADIGDCDGARRDVEEIIRLDGSVPDEMSNCDE